jgi:hypothetical protein
MISVLNFKHFERGALLGFFTPRYHGLSIQNCRLMAGKNGGATWFSFPQIKTYKDGETQYVDIMSLTNPEREHIRSLILADLQAQGHIERDNEGKDRYRTLEGEDLSEHVTPPGEDGIPF